MKTKTSSIGSTMEPQQVDFSPPKCWCESTGHYTNPEGQEFDLRVRGTNPDAVMEYMKAVRVAFEVVPLSKARPEEIEPSKEGSEKTPGLSEEEFEKAEHHAELDLEISMEVVDTQGVELPYILRTTIDPPIALGAEHRYITSTAVTGISINVTATLNGVLTELDRGSQWVMGCQADTWPPAVPSPTAQLWGYTGARSSYYLRVKGLRANNYYTVGSSITLVRLS